MNGNSFRTEITCAPSKPIALRDKILTTGSCFADQLGNWLLNNKFEVLVNPFSTNYNPISIHKNLTDSITGEVDNQLFIQQHDIWHHFDYHSHWSSSSQKELVHSIRNQQALIKEYLCNTKVIVITYGTAWVYNHKDQNKLVANCHKVHAREFNKELLSVEEITESFHSLVSIIKNINKDVRFIHTVSPVRHVKDTLQMNSVSKACLRLACHKLASQLPEVEYFPSYEIMIDDLRDYRFYDRDMIHPSQEAVEYISQKFSNQYFNQEITSFIEKWNSIKQALAHKPYHPASAAHQQFLKDLLLKLTTIKNVSVEEEIKFVQSQILPNA
jgi:DNA-directed RNA polymerase subunit F